MSLLNRVLGVNVDWVKQIKAREDQQAFVDHLANNPGIDRLKEIIKERLKVRETFKEGDYKNPSWAYLAADRTGYVRALNEILNLLEIKTHDHE